jgi:predicted nucleic acid-binding protein
MIVVSDTSPINYLILIGLIDLLPRLYGEVIIPTAVYEELTHAKTPEPVRKWIANRPEWLVVRSVSEVDFIGLHRGEAQALTLAKTLHADAILIDEHDGRAVAKEHYLRAIGTLGVLIEAADANLIDLPDAVEKLRGTSFRIANSVVQAVLERDQARRESY